MNTFESSHYPRGHLYSDPLEPHFLRWRSQNTKEITRSLTQVNIKNCWAISHRV